MIQRLILLNIEHKKELIIDLDKNWQLEVCMNENLMMSNNSFHNSALTYLKDIF